MVILLPTNLLEELEPTPGPIFVVKVSLILISGEYINTFCVGHSIMFIHFHYCVNASVIRETSQATTVMVQGIKDDNLFVKELKSQTIKANLPLLDVEDLQPVLDRARKAFMVDLFVLKTN